MNITVSFADVFHQPAIHELLSPENLNTSLSDYYRIVIKANVDEASLVQGGGAWIDVRDLSLAHLLALENETAGGERIIVCAGKSYTIQSKVD